MRTEAWIAWRLLFARKTLFGGSAPLSLFGLILGVASLVASMAVISGFERSLQSAISDVTGHVQIVKRSRMQDDWREFEGRLRSWEPSLVASVRFLQVEVLLAGSGKLQGGIIQAIDRDRFGDVLRLKDRLIDGELSLAPVGDLPGAMIGRGVAQIFGLKPGDHVRLIVPVADSLDPEKFSRKVGEFVVRGIVDLGKYEWNERFLLTDLGPAQDLANFGDRYHGLLLRFPDPDAARAAAFRLSQTLGPGYFVMDWRERNENLFEAVKLERPVIFMVVALIVLVASFNIASTLFVGILRRTEEIALLKALGLSRGAVIRIFGVQGLLMGLIGYVGGVLLGYLLCAGFSYLQRHFQLVSGSVYKLEGIEAAVRTQDLAVIALATMGICLVASLAPAIRGSRLSPMEGLRYG